MCEKMAVAELLYMTCEPERVVIITPPMPSDLASGLGSVASILWAYVWSAASAASKVTSRFMLQR